MQSLLFVYDDFRPGERKYREIAYCVFGFRRHTLPGFILARRCGQVIAVPQTHSEIDGYLLSTVCFIDMLRLQVIVGNSFQQVPEVKCKLITPFSPFIHVFAAPSEQLGDRLIGPLAMGSMR